MKTQILFLILFFFSLPTISADAQTNSPKLTADEGKVLSAINVKIRVIKKIPIAKPGIINGVDQGVQTKSVVVCNLEEDQFRHEGHNYWDPVDHEMKHCDFELDGKKVEFVPSIYLHLHRVSADGNDLKKKTTAMEELSVASSLMDIPATKTLNYTHHESAMGSFQGEFLDRVEVLFADMSADGKTKNEGLQMQVLVTKIK